MTALLDVDQLRAFIAIAETGSFTKAAEVVNKTQSAVVDADEAGWRNGSTVRSLRATARASKLTEDGQRLLDTRAASSSSTSKPLPRSPMPELSGRVRLGVPDDYADRYLPEIMARFSRAYPGVEAFGDLRAVGRSARTHRRQRSRSRHRHQLRNQARGGNLPARAACGGRRAVIRRTARARLPLALGRPSCSWRRIAVERLEQVGRPYRVIYSSSSAGAVAAAVLAGLSVSVLPGNPVCVPACACSPPPMDSPICRPAASGWCATRTRPRRWPTRWPNTSSRRSTTCRKRKRRSDQQISAAVASSTRTRSAGRKLDLQAAPAPR